MAGDSGRGSDRRTPVGRSLDRGLGAWEAFREAFGESVEEARDRGDLTTDRAREIFSRTLERAKEAASPPDPSETMAADDASDRGLTRDEFEALERRIERIESALDLRPVDSDAGGPDGGAGG